MKKLILTFIILIGIYTLLRNNVFKFPDQIMWITNHNLFYKVFLPLLMSTSAIWAIFRIEKQAYFNLAVGAMLIDAINRLSVAVNHFYGYILYKDIPIPPPQEGVTRIITNYWPSHIMLFIEIILIILVLKHFIGMKPLIVENSS